MHQSPEEDAEIRAEFLRLTNLSSAELAAFLETAESRKVGMRRKGEAESVGRQSARRILEILGCAAEHLSEADYAHMRKVIAYRRRHLAQRPWGDISSTRWRWSLMNWGHDPTKTQAQSSNSE